MPKKKSVISKSAKAVMTGVIVGSLGVGGAVAGVGSTNQHSISPTIENAYGAEVESIESAIQKHGKFNDNPYEMTAHDATNDGVLFEKEGYDALLSMGTHNVYVVAKPYSIVTVDYIVKNEYGFKESTFHSSMKTSQTGLARFDLLKRNDKSTIEVLNVKAKFPDGETAKELMTINKSRVPNSNVFRIGSDFPNNLESHPIISSYLSSLHHTIIDVGTSGLMKNQDLMFLKKLVRHIGGGNKNNILYYKNIMLSPENMAKQIGHINNLFDFSMNTVILQDESGRILQVVFPSIITNTFSGTTLEQALYDNMKKRYSSFSLTKDNTNNLSSVYFSEKGPAYFYNTPTNYSKYTLDNSQDENALYKFVDHIIGLYNMENGLTPSELSYYGKICKENISLFLNVIGGRGTDSDKNKIAEALGGQNQLGNFINNYENEIQSKLNNAVKEHKITSDLRFKYDPLFIKSVTKTDKFVYHLPPVVVSDNEKELSGKSLDDQNNFSRFTLESVKTLTLLSPPQFKYLKYFKGVSTLELLIDGSFDNEHIHNELYSAIKSLPSLRNLTIIGNGVNDISVHKLMNSLPEYLKSLKLEGLNKIDDFSVFNDTEYNKLTLSNCNISDISKLLKYIPNSGVDLDITGNHIFTVEKIPSGNPRTITGKEQTVELSSSSQDLVFKESKESDVFSSVAPSVLKIYDGDKNMFSYDEAKKKLTLKNIPVQNEGKFKVHSKFDNNINSGKISLSGTLTIDFTDYVNSLIKKAQDAQGDNTAKQKIIDKINQGNVSIEEIENDIKQLNSPIIQFKDPVLKERILSQMKLQNIISQDAKDITEEDALKTQKLDLHRPYDGHSIDLLDGIEKFKNLTELNLYDDHITDITLLAGLTNLTKLNLGNIQIYSIIQHKRLTDITPLKGLINLTELNLDSNQKISDITPLNGLTKLVRLGLSYNQIADITPLKGLINLTDLNLEHNQISDITSLKGLTKLTKFSVTDQTINFQSTTATVDLKKKIKGFGNITFNPDENIVNGVLAYKSEMKNPYQIMASETDGVCNYSAVVNVDFSKAINTPIHFKDEVLENVVKNALLEKGVGLGSSLITNLECQQLTKLSIGFPETGIGGATKRIKDLSGIENLSNLKEITVANGHDISDLSPLAQCPQLETINIAGVNNPDVTSLKALTKLKSVSLPDQNYRLTSSKDTVPLNFLHHLSDITLVSNDGNPVYGSIQGNDFILGTFPANNVARINFKCEKSSIDGVPIGTYTGTISIDYSEYRKKIEEMIKLLDEKKAKKIQGKINSGTMSMVELHKDLESVENAPVFTEKQLYKILARALGKEEGYIVKKEDLDKIQSIKLTKEEFETMEFLKNDFHQLKNLKSIDASNLGAETFNKIEYRLGTKLVKNKIKPAPLEKFSADNNHIFSIDKLSNSVITFHGQTFTNTATGRVVNISQLKYNTSYRPLEHGTKNNDKYTGLISSSLGEAFTQGQEKYGYKFIEKNFTGNVRLDKIPTKPQIDISVSNPRYNFDGVYTVDFAPYIQSLKDKVADSTAGEEEKDLVLKMINTAGTSIDDIEMAILRLEKTVPSGTQTEDISGELRKLLDGDSAVTKTDNYEYADDYPRIKYDNAIADGEKVYNKLSSTPEQVKQAVEKIKAALEALNGDKKARAIKEQLNTTTQQVSSLQEQLEKAKQQGTADKSKIEQLSGQISTLNSQLEQLKADNSKSIEQKQQEIAKLNGQIADLGKQVAQLTKDKQNLQSQIEQLNKKVDELNTKANTCSISDGEKAKELEKVKGELQQTKQQLEQLKLDKTKSDEEKQAEINKLNGQVTELGKQIEQLTEAKNSLQQQLDNANGKIQTLTGELDKAKQQGTADKATIERITGELRQTKQQLEQLKQDKTKSDEQKQKEIEQLNGKIAELGNQIKQLNSDKESLAQQLQTAQQSLSETQQKLKKAEEQGTLDSQTISGLNEQIKTLNGQIEKLKSDKTLSEQEKQAEIDKLNGQVTNLGKQVEELTKEKNSLQQQLDTATGNIQKLTGELDKAKQQGTVDKAKIEELNGKVNTLNSQLEQLKQDKTKSDDEKQQEINKLNGQIEDLNKQVTQLTKDKESLQQQLNKVTENLSNVTAQLEQAKKDKQQADENNQQTIATLNGQIAQLNKDKQDLQGQVNDKTQQISSLNSQLEQVKQDKTKSEQEKQAEIDKLNGQITQLTKDKQELQGKLDTADGKIQTLTGELDKAKQQSVTDKATIERINSELQQTKQQLEQLKQDKTKSDEEKQKEIEQLNTKITDLGKQVAQLTKDKESLAQQLQQTQQSLSDVQQKLKKAEEQGVTDNNTISELNEKIKTLSGQLEQLKQDKTKSDDEKQKEIDKLNGQVEQLNNQVTQLTKDKENLTQQLQETQGKLNTITNELSQVKKEKQDKINELNGQISQLQTDKQKLQESVADKTQQISTLNSQLEQLKQDSTKNEQEKQKEIEKLNGQISQLTKEKQELQSKLDTADSNVQKLTGELDKAKQQNTADNAKISELNEKVNTLNSQIEQLKQDKTKSVEEKQKEIDKLNGQIEDLNKQVSQLTKDKQSLQSQLEQTQQSLTDVQKKLQKAQEQGTLDTNSIAVLTQQVKTLNEQLGQLKQDKTKNEQEKQKEIEKLNGQITDLTKQVEQLTQDKKTLSEQLQRTQENLVDVQKKLQTATEQGTADKATIERINGELQQAKQQLEQLKQDKTKSDKEKQAEIDKLNGKITDLGKQIEQLTNDKNSLQSQLNDANGKIQALSGELEKAKQQGTADASTIAALNSKVNELQNKLDKLKEDKTLSEQQKQTEINKLNGQITELGKQIAQLKKEKEDLTKQIEQLNKRIEELNTKVNTCSTSDGEKAKELEKVKGELQQVKKQLEKLKQDKTKSDEQKQAEIDKLNGQIEELNKQIKDLSTRTRPENGSIILPNGNVVNPDGTVVLLDGNKIKSDGTIVDSQGKPVDTAHATVDKDGNKVLPNGIKIKPNGDKELPDGVIVKNNGNVILPDGKVVYFAGGAIVAPLINDKPEFDLEKYKKEHPEEFNNSTPDNNSSNGGSSTGGGLSVTVIDGSSGSGSTNVTDKKETPKENTGKEKEEPAKQTPTANTGAKATISFVTKAKDLIASIEKEVDEKLDKKDVSAVKATAIKTKLAELKQRLSSSTEDEAKPLVNELKQIKADLDKQRDSQKIEKTDNLHDKRVLDKDKQGEDKFPKTSDNAPIGAVGVMVGMLGILFGSKYKKAKHAKK